MVRVISVSKSSTTGLKPRYGPTHNIKLAIPYHICNIKLLSTYFSYTIVLPVLSSVWHLLSASML